MTSMLAGSDQLHDLGVIVTCIALVTTSLWGVVGGGGRYLGNGRGV